MIRPIVVMPAKILRRKMPPITDLKKARQILKDLRDTMLDSGAVGFAANQINEPYHICIVERGKRGGGEVHEFINPTIVRRSGRSMSWEGCYSLPGYSAMITRDTTIYVEHLTSDGEKVISMLGPSESFFAQHEIDHIDGILISDYVEGTHNKSGGRLIVKYDASSQTVTYEKERAKVS